MKSRRITWIGLAKGFGILCVIFGHNIECSIGHKWVYSFHMPLFFLISGFLIYLKNEQKQDMRSLVKKKAGSLLFPYIGFSLTLNAIALIGLRVFHYPSIYLQTIGDLRFNFVKVFSGDGMGTLWFLPALFVGEILLLILLKIKNKIVYSCVGGLVTFEIFTVCFKREWIDGIGNHMLHLVVLLFIRWSIAFSFVAIGFISYAILKKMTECMVWYRIAIAMFALVINVICGMNNSVVDMAELKIGNPMLFYLSACSGTIFVIEVCSMIKNAKWIRYIGLNSLLFMAVECNGSDNKVLGYLWYQVFGLEYNIGFNLYLFVGIFLLESICVCLMKRILGWTYNWDKFLSIIMAVKRKIKK